MTLRIVGADLVAMYPERYARAIGDDQARFRGPCPVCGHPTGDCTGLHQQIMEAQMSKTPKAAAAKRQGTPPEKPKAAKEAKSPQASKNAPGDKPAPSPVEAPDPAKFAIDEGATPAVAKAVAAQPTGAPNGNDEVAGGMHAASQANTDALNKPRPKGAKVPDGFEAVEGNENALRATRDHEYTFTPRGAKRTSTIQLWREGSVVPRKAVEDRLDAHGPVETK